MRPTEVSMFSTTVVSWRGGNFTAIAQRGVRFNVPSRSRSASSSTFTTVPSIS